MDVKNPRCTFLTDREVLSILQQAKANESKMKYMHKHNTIVHETIEYLKATPAAHQIESDVQKLMGDLQKGYKLTPAEILQIVNLCPKTSLELAMIIEECDERFNDDQLQSMLELIAPVETK
jgi:DNA-directed RNA polymerase subunit F